MKLIEILSESPLDQIIAQQQGTATPGTPWYKRGTVRGSSPLQAVAAPVAAPLAVAGGAAVGAVKSVVDTDQIVKDISTGAGTTLGAGTRLHQPGRAGTVQTGREYQSGKVDPEVAEYLKQAAGNKPLQQGTGHEEIDAILKNAGLLK